MRALGFQVKKAEVRKMIADIDKDETGCGALAQSNRVTGCAGTSHLCDPARCSNVDFQEFVDMMTGKMSERDSKEEIQKVCLRCCLRLRCLSALAPPSQVFALFDHDGSGRIGFRELKRVVTELGENIGDDEMREMIEEADRDGDGELAGRRGGAQFPSLTPP
jgi:Ca2+-binding EF-hand superfamily protein